MKRIAKIHSYALLLSVEHFLQAAEVPYYVKNKQVQNLFGTAFSGGINPAMGAYEIWVPEECEEKVRAILEEFLEDELPSFEKCPACEYPLEKRTEICPNCGLFLN